MVAEEQVSQLGSIQTMEHVDLSLLSVKSVMHLAQEVLLKQEKQLEIEQVASSHEAPLELGLNPLLQIRQPVLLAQEVHLLILQGLALHSVGEAVAKRENPLKQAVQTVEDVQVRQLGSTVVQTVHEVPK